MLWSQVNSNQNYQEKTHTVDMISISALQFFDTLSCFEILVNDPYYNGYFCLRTDPIAYIKEQLWHLVLL